MVTTTNVNDEERKALAKPEIEKLDQLERDVYNAYKSGQIDGAVLTGPNLVGLLGERRKIVELRSKLSGALPVEENEYD
jgi:ABC-type amino acid transport substrate-binding protein